MRPLLLCSLPSLYVPSAPLLVFGFVILITQPYFSTPWAGMVRGLFPLWGFRGATPELNPSSAGLAWVICAGASEFRDSFLQSYELLIVDTQQRSTPPGFAVSVPVRLRSRLSSDRSGR